MRCFFLHEGFYEGVQARLDQLTSAACELDLDPEVLDSSLCDYSRLPRLDPGDILYNCARGSNTLESLLLRPDVATFHRRVPSLNLLTSTTDSSILLEKAGVPVPKTIWQCPPQRDQLRRHIQELGGFPVVLKIAGGTRGIGTILISDWPQLFSTADYVASKGDRFVLRQFIAGTSVGRCRVLGDDVIQMYNSPLLSDDFRNAAIPLHELPAFEEVDFSPEIQAVCVRAAHVANSDCAAVDFIIDSGGVPRVLEVNVPAGLPIQWQRTKNQVALRMISFLIDKSKRLSTGRFAEESAVGN